MPRAARRLGSAGARLRPARGPSAPSRCRSGCGRRPLPGPWVRYVAIPSAAFREPIPDHPGKRAGVGSAEAFHGLQRGANGVEAPVIRLEVLVLAGDDETALPRLDVLEGGEQTLCLDDQCVVAFSVAFEPMIAQDSPNPLRSVRRSAPIRPATTRFEAGSRWPAGLRPAGLRPAVTWSRFRRLCCVRTGMAISCRAGRQRVSSPCGENPGHYRWWTSRTKVFGPPMLFRTTREFSTSAHTTRSTSKRTTDWRLCRRAGWHWTGHIRFFFPSTGGRKNCGLYAIS